ncbi:CehA/McbA family metallohydrolase, partial [Myxococcota bacterium]|nr:CehA/McbA family metallohydrolase [Myxococcota bacterium]
PWNGHMCIYTTEDYTSAISDIWITYIYDWLIENNALAQFNHPGRENGVFDDLDFEPDVASNMFAIETGNKGNGNADGEFLPYYIQALDNGWHLAPTSNQDNHSLSMNSHRSVFWATELTRESLVQAIRDRRFYSSDDPDVEVMFRSGEAILGGTVSMGAPGTVEFQIKVVDNEPIQKLELITGGGQVAARLEPAPGTNRITWFPTVDVSGDSWFFLKVTSEDTLDGEGPVQIAVTAPIYFVF